MRSFLTWLMVFGVLAGLNLRALSADGGHLTVCADKITHCCENDVPQQDSHHHDGDDCPLGAHHHHGCCFHVGSLTLDSDAEFRLAEPASSFLGFRHEGEVTPDGPFLGSEKPPLI